MIHIDKYDLDKQRGKQCAVKRSFASWKETPFFCNQLFLLIRQTYSMVYTVHTGFIGRTKHKFNTFKLTNR